jgi:hypothetical protein
MNDTAYERYKRKVYEKLREIDQSVNLAFWFDTVIKYCYDHGLSEERTVQTILETRRI